MQRRVDKAHSEKSRRPKTARTKVDKAAPARASIATKPTGEGTGLGLSISHDIIVKQHAGLLEVDTLPGEFTEIRVILPRAAALLPERS